MPNFKCVALTIGATRLMSQGGPGWAKKTSGPPALYILYYGDAEYGWAHKFQGGPEPTQNGISSSDGSYQFLNQLCSKKQNIEF